MRYGVRPQDGSFAKSDREYGIREAGAHVGARSAAREGARGLKYNRLASVMGMGYGIQPNMVSNVNSSAGALSGAYQNQANMFQNQGQMYNNQAYQDAYGVSNTIGNMDWAGMWNSTKGWWNQRQLNNNTSVGGYTDSDRRLKENITKIGEINGKNIYKWKWNDIARALGINSANVGVIADEHIDSGFVHVGPRGYLQVDYDGLFASS
jgi:hypothetical protein